MFRLTKRLYSSTRKAINKKVIKKETPRTYYIPDYFNVENDIKLTIIDLANNCKHCYNAKIVICHRCINTLNTKEKKCQWCLGTGYVKCYHCS